MAQVAPQEIPRGAEVTAPVPVPAFVTVNEYELSAKVAVTELAEFMVTVQVLTPAHAPDHPVKVDPTLGIAVSVTEVP